jgi:hypothetical protein
MKNDQLQQLLYEALQTEMGGVQVYNCSQMCRERCSQRRVGKIPRANRKP